MLPLFLAVFIASLLGSMHCVGMCGPLAVLSSNVKEGARPRWRNVLAYHSGRTITYAAIGALAGWLGAGIEDTGTLLGLQRLASRLAGGSMLVVGLLGIVHLMGGTGHASWLPPRLQSTLARGHAWARRQPPLRRATFVGVLTALLPCGWLYSFVLVAAGTADPAVGSLVMALFSIGSIPALVGVVFGTSVLLKPVARYAPWGSAILIALVGLVTLTQRSQVDLSKMKPIAKGSHWDWMVESVRSINQEELPCCADGENESKL